MVAHHLHVQKIDAIYWGKCKTRYSDTATGGPKLGLISLLLSDPPLQGSAPMTRPWLERFFQDFRHTFRHSSSYPYVCQKGSPTIRIRLFHLGTDGSDGSDGE